MSKVGVAIDDVIDAVAPLGPGLARSVLSFVIDLSRKEDGLDTETPRRHYTAGELAEAADELRAKTPPTEGEEAVESPHDNAAASSPASLVLDAEPANGGPTSDELACLLVPCGFSDAVAKRLAKRAIHDLGRSEGRDRLLRYARDIADLSKKSYPKADTIRNDAPPGSRNLKADSPTVADAIDYVQRHGEIKSRDYATARGLGISNARHRLRLAARTGAVECVERGRKSCWRPVQ